MRPVLARYRVTLAAALGVLLTVAALQLAQERPTLAHANLALADPAPNSVLEESPKRVVIQFTEPLEPRFSEIRVLNADADQVDNADVLVDGTDPTVMSVTLPDLPNGTYTVAWKNVSTVDGHRVRGAYIFSVGEPIAGGALIESGEPLFQSRAEPFARWSVLLGGLTVVGGIGFRVLVARLALGGASASAASRRLDRQLGARTVRIIWAALAIYFFASVWQLLTQTATTFETGLFGALGSPAGEILSGTDWGRIWIWRVGLIAGTAAVLGAGSLALPGRRQGNVLGVPIEAAAETLALGPAIASLFTLSLISHGPGTAGIAGGALLSDFVHLVGAAFWFGGLIHLLAGMRLVFTELEEGERRPVLVAMVLRFSAVALISVGALAVTGLYSAWAQVTAWRAFDSPYGYTLIAKLGLIVPLVALAGLNLLWVRPRLRGSDRAARLLRWFVAGEVVAGLLVLLSVGYLTALEPARQVASREVAAEPPTFQNLSEGTLTTVELEHARVGTNNIYVRLSDGRGQTVTNASDVGVRLSYLEDDLPGDLLFATDRGEGVWVLSDQLLSLAGEWQAQVVVRRPGAFDARTAFRFEIGGDTAGGSAAITPDRNTGLSLLGAELALIGFLFLGTGIPLGGWWTRAGASVMAPGFAVTIAGIVVLANSTLLGGQAAPVERNPFPPTAESVATGEQGYASTCMACHGIEGRGDGPVGPSLSSPPADLVVHVPLHADADLFQFIRDGIPGTAMKPLGGTLSDDEIWHVINYIKTLAE